MSFEDTFDLCSAFSANCPQGIRAAWAFEIFGKLVDWIYIHKLLCTRSSNFCPSKYLLSTFLHILITHIPTDNTLPKILQNSSVACLPVAKNDALLYHSFRKYTYFVKCSKHLHQNTSKILQI